MEYVIEEVPPEYFKTFPSLLGAKFIKIEQFEIAGEKK